MASGAVWGIDIGQCALKALRCRAGDDAGTVVAEAFDYIEYPKILSQPGAFPVELIADALKQFLSRNSVVGDRVAISVSGQSGLARFIKLPPVESKKIPDIVRYEARQQIPFDLNDVVWDYQRMGGGSEEEGFALETEVGLFAMKREAVLRAMEPFTAADVEIDIIQLTPLVLYNFLVFDHLRDLPSPEEYDPEAPPESVVIVSLGTDATDLVVTNGYRLWQRSIPLGGNHFTKALTKELKLTFSRAEHLKRNATAAPDPKALFQAMRPVFADLLTELQRSISYFSNLDRSAKIGRVVALGNAMKLPGLRRYLSQSLGYEIEKIESFPSLAGAEVVGAPSFQENLLSFGVAYGLAVQGLGKASLRTNLLPKDIIFDRLINRKKPWAVAAAALLVLGCSITFAAYALGLSRVDASRWRTTENKADDFSKELKKVQSEYAQTKSDLADINQTGKRLVGDVDGRVLWLELLKAINACLPTDGSRKADEPLPEISARNELHVTAVTCQMYEDVVEWYDHVKEFDEMPLDAVKQKAAEKAKSSDAEGTDSSGTSERTPGPHGRGWVVRLTGSHYHNMDPKDPKNQGAEFVRRTLIANLRKGKVELPGVDPKVVENVSMSELGISYPVLVKSPKIETISVADPTATATAPVAAAPVEGMDPDEGPMKGGRLRGGGVNIVPKGPPKKELKRFNFDVQFCWQPKTPSERLALKKAKAPPKDEMAQK